MGANYLSLDKLEVYKLCRNLSRIGWAVYGCLDWHDKKIFGDQFIESTDSTGANVAEGYGRYHFLDKVKFYFNARGSLLESRHWFDLMIERGKVTDSSKKEYLECYQNLRLALNGLIESTLKAKGEIK